MLSLVYPLSLLTIWLTFRFVGERWWVTTVALYLPRWVFGIPLPILTAALLLDRSRWCLLPQLVGLVLFLFPLMGLRVGAESEPTPGALRLRIASFNLRRTLDHELVARLTAAAPDLVLLQEVVGRVNWWQRELPGYTWRRNGEFAIGSRYPVDDVFVPPPLPGDLPEAGARFVRYRVVTPRGTRVHVYDLHPPSPREALEELCGPGLPKSVLRGSWPNPQAIAAVQRNAAHRLATLRALAADATGSVYPVVIAGDTNLPDQSWALRASLGKFHDAFDQVGIGFGYTFPTQGGPWMRIDRILVNDDFRVLKFELVPHPASDHLGVLADLELVGGA